MAETYHVFDIWALPIELLATLASGLRDNSRIRMKISGLTYLPVELIVPQIADILQKVYSKEDADLVYFGDIMLGKVKKNNEVRGFDSGADFMAEWKRLADKVK